MRYDTTRIRDISHIRLDGVSHSYGAHRVLTDLDLVVDGSERLGLLGENGAGKSTLLRIIAGIEQPDSGRAERPRRTTLLHQEVVAEPGDTAATLLERALAEVRAIEAELEASALCLGEAEGDARYSEALAAAERAEIWTTDARRDAILNGIGLAALPLTTRLDDMSGGQRSRFALAATLLARPTALILDEPTNHLDDGALDFLRNTLLAWRGPVVFASHDRTFLDEVATTLVDIDPSRGGATRFGGNYTEYLDAKAAERARWEAQYAEEQDELVRLTEGVEVTSRAIDGGRGRRDNDKMAYGMKASWVEKQVSRRVRNARGRLEQLEREQIAEPPAQLSFEGIPSGIHPLEPGRIVTVADAHIAGRLHVPKLKVDSTTRMLVTGPNGSGKSTLLSVIAGTLDLDDGRVDRRAGLRMALLEQDVRFADPRRTARAHYDSTLGEKRAAAVPLASLGLLSARDLDRPIGDLSVGQQRRVALALIIAKPPHLFLLDEPTNHLSLSLAQELEAALGTYPGAVVVATHDRWLRRRWKGKEVRLGQKAAMARTAEFG